MCDQESGYFHLHNHSFFSLGDALPFPPTMANTAWELGQNAIGLTDHGTMNGLIYLWLMVHEWNRENLYENGFVPLLGCEFYTVKDIENKKEESRSHLIVIAKDWKGYQAMVRMNRFSLRNSHYRPLVDHNLLQELYDEGLTKHLIATSACPLSDVNKALTFYGDDAAEKELEWLKHLFSNYYIELMDHDITAEEYSDDDGMQNPLSDQGRNEQLIEIAKRTDTPFIITNDSHYNHKDDAFAHHAYLATSSGKNINDRDPYHGHGYWLRSESEMREAFSYLSDDHWNLAVENLQKIREEVAGFKSPTFFTSDDKVEWHLPNPYEGDANEIIYSECVDGLKNRVKCDRSEQQRYVDQVKHELKIICGAGFAPYFLMVSEFVKWAKHEAPCEICGENEDAHLNGDKDHPYFGILVGPGRGSACGCLVAFLLEITEIDPLKYGLSFERFLDEEKIKHEVPDIDVDFQHNRRDEVIQHIIDYYGEENVSKTANWGRRQEAGAWTSACTALGIDFGMAKRVTKMLHQWPSEEGDKLDPGPVRLERLFSNEAQNDPSIPEDIKQLIRDYPQLEYLSLKFYKTVKNVGTHAASVLITTPGLLESIDHQTKSGSGGDAEIVSGFAYGQHGNLGLVKNDILGLKNLTVVQEARKLVWYSRGIDVFEEMQEDYDRFEDSKVYEMLSEGDTQGVFQFEGGAFAPLCKKLKVRDFTDMVDINALSRPGPNQFVDIYHDAKFSNEKFDYPNPRMKDIFAHTYGILIYEEQVLKLASEVAQLPMKLVLKIKKAIKYYIKELMEELEGPFIEGLIENGGFTEDEAKEWWNKVVRFAGYGFNLSHCLAYSVIGYQTAYLKVNYPVQFFAALLSESGESGRYLPICRRRGIEVLPPCINSSGENYKVVDDKIRLGLMTVKDVGYKAAKQIVDAQPFENEEEFWKWYEEGLDDKPRPDHRSLRSKTLDALKAVGAMQCIGIESQKNIGKAEMEYLGLHVTYDPLVKYREILDEYIFSDKNQYRLNGGHEDGWAVVGGLVTRLHKHQAKSGEMAFAQVKMDEIYEWDLVIFPKQWSQVGSLIHEGEVIIAKGEWQPDKESLLAFKIMPKPVLDKVIEENYAEAVSYS